MAEALANHLEHDVNRYGCTRRRSQQCGNAAIGICNHFGSIVNNTRLSIFFLDRLNAYAGIDEPPIFVPGFWIKVSQYFHPLVHALCSLLDQIPNERQIIETHFDQRSHVVQSDRTGQVEEATVTMQKLGCPSCVRTEE